VRWARFTPGPAPEGSEPKANPIFERIASLSPTAGQPATPAPGQTAPPMISINVKIAELIASATSATNLGRMPPGWQAWL
jgi:hypothetical protein